MANACPKLLLVSHPDKVAEVREALISHGLGEAVIGAGGDETLDLFEVLVPDVVIMVAGLGEEGDLPSLAGAMRSGHYGRPAPIILVVGDEQSTSAVEAAGKHEFERVVRGPLVGSELADAVRHCNEQATDTRISAAMDLAIESFVLEAMESLSAPGVSGSGNVEPLFAEREPEPESWRQATELARPTREPTAVLPESSSHHDFLNPASLALLDEVLPGETLEVDLEELDSLCLSSARDDADVSESKSYAGDGDGALASPPGGGDFARQLRLKMSAMAERLFPGHGADEMAADLEAESPAHTEIDLGEIPEEESPEPDVEGSRPGSVSGLGDSGTTTMAQDLGSGVGSASLTRPRASGSGAGQALVGVLDCAENDIATVLSRLWQRAFTGCLVMVREHEEKRIHFEKGRVVFASSTQEADRMGELLLREGKISMSQLQDCRAQVTASGSRLGEVLVDQGYLKPRELLPAVRHHLEDIVYSVFSWEDGSYDALPEQSIEERIRLSRHSVALVVEGIRRKYDRGRLEACLGGMGTVLMNEPGDSSLDAVSAADLSGSESVAQRLFDGEHSLEDVRVESGLEGLRVAQLAHAWLCLGAAKRVERARESGGLRVAAAGHLIGETDIAIDRQRVRAKYLLVQEADYFQLLGVRPDASGFEIQRAYEAALTLFRTESFPGPLQDELSDQLSEIASVIDEAYQVLRDDRIRELYRENLR